ncbi:MAG TPA: biotin carboxylase N-terminal domain-containing protein [Candidatus Limnocylindrales bacterium]|nr:biotin carboxylase N-terminal domain-containing protein [Candidatus Limnocylindrales bacterium]
MFSSVLVANRGEIALRVMRSCARLGIRTIAVYSDADARSLHRLAADEAVRIGPGPAAESYLRADRLIEAALATRAEAIHPGYGFLAENPAFAEDVVAAGVAWIGPPPSAMRALGDKARAKALAEANGVPVLPGYHGDVAADEDLVAEAARIGYPVLVKASAGGGGRGMRVVRAHDDLRDALAAARREADAAFGDDRLLLERFVERPRHVEIQLLADAHGTIVHLGERECSIQRRHQKLVEESPSPAVDDDLRAAMGDAAIRLARAAGYVNAGTAEFLLDERGAFHFLEVNARLQVEHPVTEAVARLDLVEQQLRIAAGDRLGFGQQDVRLEGHAIEVRIVAEDVAAGFLPATGRVTAFDVPDGVRVDAGVAPGTAIPSFYDSLVAKVIVHARDRPGAVQAMAAALDATRLEGVASNLELLAAIVDEPAFRSGALTTAFLDEHAVVDSLKEVDPRGVAAVAAARSLGPAAGDEDDGPWSEGRPWRAAGVGERTTWLAGDRTIAAELTLEGDGTARVVVDGTTFHCRLTGRHDEGEERRVAIDVDREIVVVHPAVRGRFVETASVDGRATRLRLAPPPSGDRAGAEARDAGALAAPMPGRIVRVHVAEGDHVAANDPLLVLEAMKMEHVIAAAGAGRVSRLLVEVGDQVARGATLVTLDADGAR